MRRPEFGPVNPRTRRTMDEIEAEGEARHLGSPFHQVEERLHSALRDDDLDPRRVETLDVPGKTYHVGEGVDCFRPSPGLMGLLADADRIAHYHGIRWIEALRIAIYINRLQKENSR
jgi:hypothetical protein